MSRLSAGCSMRRGGMEVYTVSMNDNQYSEEDVVTGERLIRPRKTPAALEFALAIVRNAKVRR